MKKPIAQNFNYIFMQGDMLKSGLLVFIQLIEQVGNQLNWKKFLTGFATKTLGTLTV